MSHDTPRIPLTDMDPGQPEGLTRRQMLAGLAAIAVLAACQSGGSTTEASRSNSSVSSSESPLLEDNRSDTIRRAAQEKKEIAEMPPAIPTPLHFKDGEFIGAVVIDYRTDVTRQWDAIDAYFAKNGTTRPKMNEHFVHRLVASDTKKQLVGKKLYVGAAITKDNLDNGVVLSKSSTPDVLVMMMHDVTAVHAPVSVNGKVSAQSEMGVNAVVEPGDRLSWLLPASDGKIHRFTYEAVDSYIQRVPTAHTPAKEAAVLQERFNTRLNKATKAGEPILRTYKCWKPGDDSFRLVDEWKLVSREEVQGSVKPVGTVAHSGSNR